VGENITNMRI